MTAPGNADDDWAVGNMDETARLPALALTSKPNGLKALALLGRIGGQAFADGNLIAAWCDGSKAATGRPPCKGEGPHLARVNASHPGHSV